MPLGVLPLSTLCVNVLLQNHRLLNDLGDVRYPLIKRVLFKLTSQQLTNLEQKNPMLIFEDSEIWENLIKKEFPQELSERFTNNKSKIRKFYELQLNEFHFDYSDVNVEHYINLSEVEANVPIKKYKLPSKLVYLKLLQDYQEKKELAIENLRQRMQDIEKSKEKTKVIQLNEVIPVEPISISRNSSSSSLSRRSKLFQKSHLEAKKHRDHFKNPMNTDQRIIHRQVIRTPDPKSPTPMSPVCIPSKTSATRTSPLPKQQVSSLPTRKTVKQTSIFLQKRSSPKRKKSPSIVDSQRSSVSVESQFSTVADLPPPPSPPERKRIKLGEYLARNTR